MLPQAHNPEESIIVRLDWFSGHLAEAVAELVASKGHVLLFHGGATTPFTQINNTHLHAMLQRFLMKAMKALSKANKKDTVHKGSSSHVTKALSPDLLLTLVWCRRTTPTFDFNSFPTVAHIRLTLTHVVQEKCVTSRLVGSCQSDFPVCCLKDAQTSFEKERLPAQTCWLPAQCTTTARVCLPHHVPEL